MGSLADDKTDLVDDKGNVVADRVFPLSTNKGRRILLKRIVRLCEQKALRAKLEFVLRGLMEEPPRSWTLLTQPTI